jgi:hypothetical protein
MATAPKAKGEISEGIVAAHLLRLGYSVSFPFGNSQRYDLILDLGDRLQRVQVKTGRLNNGCVRFPTVARNAINGKRSSYHGLADLIMVYCPGTGKVYAIPVTEQTNASEMFLRIEPARGGPKGTIKWAADYEFPPGGDPEPL